MFKSVTRPKGQQNGLLPSEVLISATKRVNGLLPDVTICSGRGPHTWQTDARGVALD